MRTYPDDDGDREELAKLNAAPWMADQLRLNPEYVFWGPHEDYMIVRGDGWGAPVFVESWSKFGWVLDEMNECANFYFEINRESKACETCGENGYHPNAQWISESFYSHSSPFKQQTRREVEARAIMDSFGGGPRMEPVLGRGGFPGTDLMVKYGSAFRAFCEEMREYGCWNDRITQDEVDALQEAGRLRTWKDGEWRREPLTAEAVNLANQRGPGICDFNHDGINRAVLISRRCERLGVPLLCPTCNGSAHVYTAPAAHLSLVLWMLHPRKGASRGVEIKRIEESDLPAVHAWLRKAAERNTKRFAKLPAT